MILRPLVLLVALLPASAGAAELCRFAGTTSHDGHVAVTTEVSGTSEALTVDVAFRLTASFLFYDVEYLVQEISAWRDGELQSVAVNGRTIVDGDVKRQQWDVFLRRGGALEAQRVQAKRLTDFRARHPAFVGHWALAGFGLPWLQDYAAAGPERRPDLDLPSGSLPPGLRSPLALAFYWSRYLAPGGGVAPLFLPGFKHDKRSDVAFGPATEGQGWRRWQATLRHPGLSGSTPSIVAAWVSPNNYLLQLALDMHAHLGSAQALVRAEGCQGIQVAPVR